MSHLLDPDEMPPWISTLWPAARRPAKIIAGVNDDDCAVLEWGDRYFIGTMDFLNANPIALELKIGTLWDLGRLVVAANLSDLCGSGAKPLALFIGVTLPRGATKSDFRNFIKGVKMEADRHGVPVVGGDSKLGDSRALMAVAIGSAASRKQLFLKNGAKKGDLIWASGNLGSVAAAVWGYGRAELSDRWKAWARDTLLVPKLPLKVSQRISLGQLGRGGTDISDGLGADLLELCKGSGVGARVDAHKIPFAPEVNKAAEIAGVEPWRFAFASGGDFQFVVTTAKNCRRTMNRLGCFEIGEITDRPELRIRLPTGRLSRLPVKGHRDRRGQSFAQEIDALIKIPFKTKIFRQ